MNQRSAGLAYAATTLGLLVASTASQWCFDVSGVSNAAVRGTCIAIWAISGVLLALSQIAFIVIAVRIKHYVLLFFASGILLAIGAFVFLLSIMPS